MVAAHSMSIEVFLALLLTPPLIAWLYMMSFVYRRRRLVKRLVRENVVPEDYSNLKMMRGQYDHLDPRLKASGEKGQLLLRVWIALVLLVCVGAVVGGYLLYG